MRGPKFEKSTLNTHVVFFTCTCSNFTVFRIRNQNGQPLWPEWRFLCQTCEFQAFDAALEGHPLQRRRYLLHQQQRVESHRRRCKVISGLVSYLIHLFRPPVIPKFFKSAEY